MDVFACLRSPTVEQPPFGRLSRCRGKWRGQITLENLPAAGFSSPGPRSGPDLNALTLAREFIARWPGLRPPIAAALYEHYVPYREAFEAGELRAEDDPFLNVMAPEGTWEYVYDPMVAIRVHRGTYEVLLGLRVGWDVEHTVGAIVRDWVLTELSGSIGRFEL